MTLALGLPRDQATALKLWLGQHREFFGKTPTPTSPSLSKPSWSTRNCSNALVRYLPHARRSSRSERPLRCSGWEVLRRFDWLRLRKNRQAGNADCGAAICDTRAELCAL